MTTNHFLLFPRKQVVLLLNPSLKNVFSWFEYISYQHQVPKFRKLMVAANQTEIGEANSCKPSLFSCGLHISGSEWHQQEFPKVLGSRVNVQTCTSSRISPKQSWSPLERISSQCRTLALNRMARTDMGDDRLWWGFEICRDQIFLGRVRRHGHDVENTHEWWLVVLRGYKCH